MQDFGRLQIRNKHYFLIYNSLYVGTHARTYVHVCAHARMQRHVVSWLGVMDTKSHVRTYVRTYIGTCVIVCVTYVCVCVCARECTQACARAHSRLRTCVHAHARSLVRSFGEVHVCARNMFVFEIQPLCSIPTGD